MPTPVLEVDHVTKTFRERGGRVFKAVDDLSLTVMEGESVGVVGEIRPIAGGVLGDSAPVVDEWSDFVSITSTNTTRTLTGEDFRRGFVMTQIETGEEHDFSAPPDATIVSDWQAFGAATDWIYVALTNWAFSVATNDVERLRVYSFCKIEPLIREEGNAIATNYWFAPFMASLGVVPEANWGVLAESARPSRVWYCVTHRNTFVITWENVLLDRDAGSPISFQIEFWSVVKPSIKMSEAFNNPMLLLPLP